MADITSAIHYCHETTKLVVRMRSMGLLKVQIMEYLQIVCKSI